LDLLFVAFSLGVLSMVVSLRVRGLVILRDDELSFNRLFALIGPAWLQAAARAQIGFR
jgi:hypothetical protein